MKKRLLVLVCACVIGLCACGNRQAVSDNETQNSNVKMETQDETKNSMEIQTPDTLEVNNKEKVEEQSSTEESIVETELTEDEMLERFYDQFYDGYLSEERMIEILNERAGCYQASCYYDEITYYWEVICGATDVSNHIDPLFFTDMKYYTEEDFVDVPPTVIHLAKNEIYAKHGYIFKSEDLNNYFLGCAWYTPTCTAEEFDDSVFNEYERANLELLARLDKEGFQQMISSAEPIEDTFYNADDYGYIETKEQIYTNFQGQECGYADFDCYYFVDEANQGKYDLVNQTLQKIYDEKEAEYRVYCEEYLYDYEADDESIAFYLYLVSVPYVGEDYVSLIFNDIVTYAGAAHPATYFVPVTISVETGEIVTPEEVLNMSWSEICATVGMNEQNEEEFMEEYGFYLTDHTLTYKYRTNAFVEDIVIKR